MKTGVFAVSLSLASLPGALAHADRSDMRAAPGRPAASASAIPAGVQVGAVDPRRLVRTNSHRCNCVPPALSAAVREQIVRNRVALGLAPSIPNEGGLAGAGAPPYLFYPMAGNHAIDIFSGGFVDLDPDPWPEFIDYACRPFTYNGHAGIDTGIRSFDEQFIGIPVYAAADGVVVFTQDGFPDTNTNGGFGGNIIAIDHADGIESQYYHLKQNSVAVTLGQIVKSGQPIGMVGSSGNSFGPHLHFQTMLNDTVVVEPFFGACQANDSLWADQEPLDTDALFLHDFGITRTDLFELPHPWWEPWALPTDGQFHVGDPAIRFWWTVYNFPLDCEIHVRFFRPNGSLAWNSQWNWGNTEKWRFHKNWFGFDFQPMGPVVGTWRIVFELDGELMIDAPFEVAATLDPLFNRAPEPIVASFSPSSPESDDVIFCSVAPGPGAAPGASKEDLDWDIVRYHYVWSVDGDVVRDVTTAAQSDAVASETAPKGSTLSCSVTPNDGIVDGASTVVQAVIGGSLFGDLDGNGVVNGGDMGLLLGSWGACANCAADLDGDGVVGGGDMGLLLGAWT